MTTEQIPFLEFLLRDHDALSEAKVRLGRWLKRLPLLVYGDPDSGKNSEIAAELCAALVPIFAIVREQRASGGAELSFHPTFERAMFRLGAIARRNAPVADQNTAADDAVFVFHQALEVTWLVDQLLAAVHADAHGEAPPLREWAAVEAMLGIG
jgi:hypothetical protein